MKQWRCVLELYLFANDMSDFFAELDNGFWILKNISSVFSASTK